MTEFSRRLLAWFDEHGRKDLPWQVAEPYAVWVSEIMLQQTQVRTVIPYYTRFMQRFATINALANAEADDVMAHWSGLGYYARARNLHKAAQHIRDEHDGCFPLDFDRVAALPGIGRSTAGAILALADGQRHSILDGNVKRVLARHAAIEGWPGKTAVARELWTLAEAHTPATNVAEYTQAIMDLGATLCTRTRPRCDACPVHSDCEAFAADSIGRYPGRKPKKAKPLRQTTMLLAVAGDRVFLERRPPAGIWGGLWSFPECQPDELDSRCLQVGDGPREEWQTLRHSFSHYDLDISPVVLRLDDVPASVIRDSDAGVWYRLDDAPPGGLAAPVRKLMDTLRSSHDVQNR